MSAIETGAVRPEEFRAALACWTSGVAVVAARESGLVYGITVSSFSSLSLDPPLVLVSLRTANRLPGMITASGRFSVSVLAESQRTVAERLAVSGREPGTSLGDIATLTLRSGCPAIAGSIARLDCALEQTLTGGDHTIVIGRVDEAVAETGARPLAYFGRSYRTLEAE